MQTFIANHRSEQGDDGSGAKSGCFTRVWRVIRSSWRGDSGAAAAACYNVCYPAHLLDIPADRTIFTISEQEDDDIQQDVPRRVFEAQQSVDGRTRPE